MEFIVDKPRLDDKDVVAYLDKDVDSGNIYLIIKEDHLEGGAVALSKLGVGAKAEWMSPEHNPIKLFYKGDEVTIKF